MIATTLRSGSIFHLKPIQRSAPTLYGEGAMQNLRALKDVHRAVDAVEATQKMFHFIDVHLIGVPPGADLRKPAIPLLWAEYQRTWPSP